MTEIDLTAWSDRLRGLAERTAADAAHDISHLRRVVATAARLAAREQAHWEIVLPAAWLHDCVAFPKNSPDRVRASTLAADRAMTLLREVKYPETWLAPVRHCIVAHSFSAGIAAESLEAKVLQDADRLDALGAIGIARCFSVGGALGRPIYTAEDPFCVNREPDDSKCSVDHFFQKLFRICETMQTQAGREEAQRRVAFMHDYLEQLRHEIER